MAIFTQFIASFSLPSVSGSPKKIIIESPIYLSIVPPKPRAISDIFVRYKFSISVSGAESILSEISVNEIMSEKNTVKNFFSLSIETFFSPLKIESYNCGERYLDNWLAISSISLLF